MVGMLWYCNLSWRIGGEDVVCFIVYGCWCVVGIDSTGWDRDKLTRMRTGVSDMVQ